MTNQQRIDAVRNRLAELAGNRACTIERGLLRDELRRLQRARSDDSEDESPVTSGDSVWETLRKIASMGDTVKIMCEDRSVNVQVQVLMAAGFRGAVRLAKQALADAGKDAK
jgi:hypothetical protein